jgi:hypothetical protein
MRRTLIVVLVSLFAASPVIADQGTKVTVAELKEMTSKAVFRAGWSQYLGAYADVLFPDGTREAAWTNGVKSETGKGKWRIDGDKMCVGIEKRYETCAVWTRNGERIQITPNSYFYIVK